MARQEPSGSGSPKSAASDSKQIGTRPAPPPGTAATAIEHPRAPAAAPARRATRDINDPLTLGFVVASIQRWWPVALAAALVLAFLTTSFLIYSFQPTYRATAWLRIDERTPYLAFQERGPTRRLWETQAELLHSPLVIGRAIADPRVSDRLNVEDKEALIAGLAKWVEVELIGDSELVEVSYSHRDPEFCALLLNTIVDSYFTVREEQTKQRSARVLDLLMQEQQQRYAEVQRLRDSVRQLAKKLGSQKPFVGSGQSGMVVVTNPLEQIEERLATAEIERQVTKARVEAIKNSINAPGDGAPPVPSSEQVRKVEQLEDEIVSLEDMVRDVRAISVTPDSDPLSHVLTEKIKQRVDTLQRIHEHGYDSARSVLGSASETEQQRELRELSTRLEELRLTEETLRKRYEEQLTRLRETEDPTLVIELELEFAKSELVWEEKAYESISERVLERRTEMNAPARVTLERPAIQPGTPVERLPLKKLAAAVLGSFLLPFGLVVVWEHRIRRIESAAQIERRLGVPVVGEVYRLRRVPRLTSDGRTAGVTVDQLMFQESIENLRSCAFLAESQSHARLLTVVSAMDGEGKTTIATFMATSVARFFRERTLMIDADMRSPDVHQVLGLPLDPGVVGVMTGKCSLQEAVVTDYRECLDVLPAGNLEASAHDLVGEEAFRLLLEEACRDYRYVIVDTPPILVASESLVLAKRADYTLICTMHGKSREAFVETTLQRLASVGARPVGAVLCGVRKLPVSSSYHKYAYPREPAST